MAFGNVEGSGICGWCGLGGILIYRMKKKKKEVKFGVIIKVEQVD